MNKIIESVARRVNQLKEDPEDWANFITDAFCVLGITALAVVALALMWWEM